METLSRAQTLIGLQCAGHSKMSYKDPRILLDTHVFQLPLCIHTRIQHTHINTVRDTKKIFS